MSKNDAFNCQEYLENNRLILEEFLRKSIMISDAKIIESAVTPKSAQNDIAEQLIKIKTLLDSGVITQEEFSDLKKKIIKS